MTAKETIREKIKELLDDYHVHALYWENLTDEIMQLIEPEESFEDWRYKNPTEEMFFYKMKGANND